MQPISPLIHLVDDDDAVAGLGDDIGFMQLRPRHAQGVRLIFGLGRIGLRHLRRRRR